MSTAIDKINGSESGDWWMKIQPFISAALDAKSTFIICCSFIDILNNSIGQLDNKSGNKILNNLLKYPIGDPYNLNLSKFDRVHNFSRKSLNFVNV